MTALLDAEAPEGTRPPGSWDQAPGVPSGEPGRLVRDLLAILIAVTGPFLRTMEIVQSEWVVRSFPVGVVGSIAVVVVGRIPTRWWLRLLIALGAGGVAAACGGRSTGLWLVGTILLATWVVRGFPPVPGLPEGHDGAIPPVIVLQILATIRGRQTLAVAAPLVLTAIGFVVALVVCSLGDRFQGPVDRFSRAVGSAVSRVCFLALGVFVVILPWVAHRIFRIDPLAAPRSASGATAWIERGRRDLQPASPWAADPAVLRPTLWFRVRQIVAVPVVLVAAILAFAAIPTKGFEDETKGPTYHAPTVFEDSPWYQDYEQDINWYMTIGFDPTRNPRLRDAHSRYVNVVDGARTSWTPAACDCRRLVVWVYGGSTTFGIGQRDEHTIPSELARLASEDGIAIDVVNRGVPGDLHWMEANRFAWDIAVNDPPDLVVFYDGINEMMAAFQAQDTGRSTSMTAPIDPTMEKLGDRDLAQFGYQGSNPADGPADAAVDPPKALPTVEAEEFGAMAAKRYEASRTASRALAEAEGVPVAWFWQPSLYTRTHKVEGEPDDDPAGDEFNEAIWASARDHLADDVVDLTPTLEDRDVGVFFDGMHTNELGSRLVAEGMYRSLRDQLRALVEEQP